MKQSDEMLELIQEVSLDELDQVIGGAGNGVIRTITQGCRMPNNIQVLFTC